MHTESLQRIWNARLPIWAIRQLAPITGAMIELYWGAAFEWLAYGAEHKHGKHKELHEGLVRFLRDLGESAMADRWAAMEGVRRGGFYGHHNALDDVQEAMRVCQDIRTWALS
jgi:hypothetical protein